MCLFVVSQEALVDNLPPGKLVIPFLNSKNRLRNLWLAPLLEYHWISVFQLFDVCQDFRAGMNLYLCRHQYSNTFTEDLWAALEEASSKPVASVMSTWTKQMGFPVITVESISQEANKRTFVLTQAKFCADSKDVQNGMLMIVSTKVKWYY